MVGTLFRNIFFLTVLALISASCTDDSELSGKFSATDIATNQVDTAEKYGYHTIPEEDQMASDNSQKELIYFFSYACPHCNNFEPYFNTFIANSLPEWISVRYVPISVRPDWYDLAKFYFALHELNEETRMKQIIFNAIHPVGSEEINTEYFEIEKLVELALQNGVDTTKLSEQLNDKKLNDKITESINLIAKFGIRSTPTLVYDGKFLIETNYANKYGGILRVLEKIIEKEKENLLK